MDNKDEKTFADLFSSSTTEKETTTQTFSDILNNDAETKEDSNSSVTFDSLFDKISPADPQPIEVSNNSNTIESSTNEPAENIIKQDQEITLQENNSGNIFFSNEPALITEIEIFDKKDEPEKIVETDNAETTLNISKPLFTEESVKEADKIEENIDETIPSNEQETESEIKIDNPFFQATAPIIEDIIATENKENSKEIEASTSIETNTKETVKEEVSTTTNSLLNNGDIFATLKEEKKADITVTESPFFTEETSNVEEPKSEENIFFSEKNEPLEEPKNESNPFFNEVDQHNQEIRTETQNSTTEPNNPILNNSITSSVTKETTVKDEEKPKSTSPFFEEEKKSEENPFFQNQLNLIENQIPNAPSSNIDTAKSKHYNVKIVKKKEPLIKSILGVLSYAIFICLLFLGITLLIYVLDIKIRAAKGDYSAPTFNAYVVLTGSMLPEIEVSDVVITKKVDAEKLKEGDIITFASADSRFLGTIITHRIIKKNPKTDKTGYTFQTKGDNNNVADSSLVPEKNIYGKVILKIPKLGYLQEFLASDGGWIIVILIPCLTVLSYDIVKLIKGLKRKKYKNIKVQK